MMNLLPKDFCTICGTQARLSYHCSQCGKGACNKPDCIKHISRVDQCRVPGRGQQYVE